MVGVRRRLLLGLIAAAGLVLAGWFFARAPSGPNGGATTSGTASATAEGLALDPRAQESASTREQVAAESASSAAAAPTISCTVFGRVLGQVEGPLSGLTVTFYSNGPWGTETEGPYVVIDGREVVGFSATTDASGRFSFDVPLPAAWRVTLRIEPDPVHLRAERAFDAWGTTIRAGANDLGDITLQSAAAIEGHVRSASGDPIEGAEIAVSCPGVPDLRLGRSDAEGRYTVGGLLEGNVRAGVSAAGWIHVEGAPIEVRPGEVRRDVDFVLSPSPTIAGRAVDDRGTPVFGVEVRAIPTAGGHSAEARTSEDGSFTLSLMQDAPHWLSASHPTHEKFDGNGPIAPGTNDALVQLVRLPALRLCVVERSSGLAIETYGLALEVLRLPRGPGYEKPPSIGPHPGGCYESFRPRGRVFANVEAPGYAPASIEIVEPVEVETRLPLDRGSTVRGRAIAARAPAAGARVRIERAVRADEMHDLNPLLGRLRIVETDAEGRFEFVDLAQGTYRLVVNDVANSPFEIERLEVGVGADQDLGDLELSAGGSLRGRITIAAGVPAERWTVGLGDQRLGRTGWVDGDGRFEISALVPGSYDLWVDPPGASADVERRIEIVAGETTEVELDFADRTPGRIQLRVTRAGSPLAGYRVVFECEGEKDSRVEVSTDSAGLAVATVLPCSALRASVMDGPRFELARSPAPFSVLPAARVEGTLEVDAGELTLVFPEDVSVLPNAMTIVTLYPGGFGANALRMQLRRPREHWRQELGAREWTGSEVDIGLVPPGTYRVKVGVSVPGQGALRGILVGDVEIRPLQRSICRVSPPR